MMELHDSVTSLTDAILSFQVASLIRAGKQRAGFASAGADRLVNKKTVFHAVMANTDCHPERI